MVVYPTKTDYNSSTNVGPNDLNRMELNILKLATLQNIRGTFGPVTSTTSTQFQDLAVMRISFPDQLVGIGLKVDFRILIPFSENVRCRIGSNYYYGTTSKIDVVSAIDIVIQARGYGLTNSEGDIEYYPTTVSKTDPEIRSYFYDE